jgi:ACS family allantoate permease-like MFS transporter
MSDTVILIFVRNIMNSLSNQRQLIVKQFGFSPVHTTLIGCVDGVVESKRFPPYTIRSLTGSPVISIIVGVSLASVPVLGRAYSGVLIYAVAITGAILVNTLPSHNKIGLLISYWVSSAQPSSREWQ